MSLVRRLLMVSGGSGSIPAPVLSLLTIATAPNGGWTQIPDPKFPVSGGKVFLDWVNGTSGDVEYAHWDIGSQTLSMPQALGVGLTDDGPPDNHNSGSVLVRSSDARLIAAYAGHEDDRVRVRISTSSNDASAWGSEVALDPGYGGVYTYCTLVELTGEGKIYLFARSIPNVGAEQGSLVYATSTDNGASWSSWTRLFTGTGLTVPYWRIGNNGTDRIDVFTTDMAPTTSALYHFYLTGGSRYETDGTLISASLPLEVSNLTLVKSNSEGAVWSWGASYAADDSPASVVMIKLSGSNNSVRVARWNGSAWVLTEVAQTDGVLGVNQFASGAAIGRTNPNLVYMARKVSGKFEMYRYTSADDGATWSGAALTSGSASDNVWPDTTTNGSASLEALWLYGSYTGDTSYSFGVRGAGYR